MNIEDMLGGNMQGLLEKAQQMQQDLQEAQARAQEKVVSGEAGGGMVKVSANGKLEILSVTIDPLVATGEDLEMLQDLVVAAVNDALRRARETVAEEMGPLAEVMKSSGFGL